MLLNFVIRIAIWSGVSTLIAGYWSWLWPAMYTLFAFNYQMGMHRGRMQHLAELDRLTHELSDLRMRLWKTEQERDEARDKLPKPILVPRRGAGWGIN